MEHICWINPYTCLYPQPDSQAPQTAALLGWFVRVEPMQRQVIMLGCAHLVQKRDDEGVFLDGEVEDEPVVYFISCN